MDPILTDSPEGVARSDTESSSKEVIKPDHDTASSEEEDIFECDAMNRELRWNEIFGES